jgi:hypothetical protein
MTTYKNFRTLSGKLANEIKPIPYPFDEKIELAQEQRWAAVEDLEYAKLHGDRIDVEYYTDIVEELEKAICELQRGIPQ